MSKYKETTEILQRLIELENKVASLEHEKEYLVELIDHHIETLESKILDKCYCRVYEKDFLVKLLEKAKKNESR